MKTTDLTPTPSRHLVRSTFAALLLACAATSALADAASVLRSIKGFALGMPKVAALKVVDDLRLGVKFVCWPGPADEVCYAAGTIPPAAGFTLGREPVHALALTFSGGTLQQIGLTMGNKASPARDGVIGELGETLSAAIGAGPQVFAGSEADIVLRWKDDRGELLLSTGRLPQGTSVQVFLRNPARAPKAFTERSRGHARFLSDL